jgi:O6-methylguanine-DNA--protein-cysteine methyltransferase
MSQDQEPQDTEAYLAIWNRATIDRKPVKVYQLTKLGLDRVKAAATTEDLQALRAQLNSLMSILKPILLPSLKQQLLQVLDAKQGRVLRTLVNRIPYGDFYGYSLIFEALRELVQERKVVDTKGHGWRKK